MERNREGRRGGNGSANVSSSRRLRTSTVKDASEDDSQNSRLQKSKKGGFYSRKRRNCRSFHDESQQLLHTGQSDERDDSFEETAMAVSEEDADLQPPAIRRGSGKLKIHMKARVDVSTIDMAVVPRKLRTAMMRRYHELTSPHDAETRKESNIEIVAVAPTCSNASLKPGRRKRPNNHKLRPAKFRKVSPTMISEQEAEVAETLFDLARMVSSQAISLISDVKSEPTSEMKLGPSPTVSPLSPVQDCYSPAATASSPSFNHTSGDLGDSKAKGPQASSMSEDAGQAVGGSESTLNVNRCLFTSSMEVAMESADPEQVADGNPVQTEASTSRSAALSMIASTAIFASTSTDVSLAPTKTPQTVDQPTFQDNNIPQVDSSNDELKENVPSTSMLSEIKASLSSLGDIRNVGEKDMLAVESSIAREASTELGVENRLQQCPLARTDYPGNFEIDLMASPKSVDKINGIRDSNKIDIKEEQEVDLTSIPTAENSITDVQRCEEINETKKVQTSEQENPIIQKIEPGWNKDWEAEKTIEQFNEMPNQSYCFKDKPKQERATAKTVNADSRVQIGDRPATIMMTTANTMTSTTLPISMAVTGWPGGLPPLGYYSPMASATTAAWRSPLPLTGPSIINKNITPSPQPFLQMWQSRKRSATHVYITLFIDTQQQLKKNPLWAAAYGAKAYNLNIPMAPDGLMGVSVGSALEPEIRATRLAVGSINGSGYGMPAVAKDASFNTYIDADGRQPLLQQKTHASQQEPASFSQAGPAFVLPATNSASASAAGSKTAGGSVGASEAILGRGSSASFHSSSVCDVPANAEGGLSNGSVASAAAIQTQHLHSVIGHNTFPYSFSHGQFGPLFNGYLSPQQVAQYYSNHFVGPHFVQPAPPPQQSQGLSNLMSEVSVSQKQRDSQGACRLASSVSPDQHQHSLGTTGDSSQHLEHVSKKENVAVNGISMAEMKSMIPRNIYGQNFPSLQVSNMNFPSAILATGMPTFPAQPPDLKQMGSLTGKNSGKMDQQAQTSLQSHSQSKLKLQQQQQDIDMQNHVASSALQMSIKMADFHASHPLPAMSIDMNTGSDTTLGLSAVTSVMASQGHAVPQTMGGSTKSVGQHQTVLYNPLVSGKSYKLSIDEGQQQQQQYHTQAQGAVSGGVEDIKISVTEGSYSRCKEDRKSNGKHELNQSNMLRVDSEASPTKDASILPSVAGSHTNIVAPTCQGRTSISSSVSTPDKQFYQSSKHMVNYKSSSSSNIPSAPSGVESTVSSLSERTPTQSATYGKMPPEQASPFSGHSVSSSGESIRQGDTWQQQGKLSQQSLAGSPMSVAVTSGSPPQATLTSVTKTQGLLPKSSQSATNVIPISRMPPASSISSAVATPLPPQSPVSKNGIFVRDSLSLKSSFVPTSAKKSSLSGPLAQNLPLKPSQAHLIQNQYNIHHQHIPYLLFQQNVQPMDSSQQQQLPLEQQQYPLPYNQQQALHVQNQSLAQQPQLQFRPHLLTQQNPQYLQLQSHIYEQAPSQPSMMYLQKTTQQMKQQSGQMSSQPQQLGNMQQQALELQQQQQKLPTPTSFSITTNGALPAASSLCASGNNPETMISYGPVISQGTSARPLTPTKLTSDINMSVLQKGNGAGPAFVLSQRDPSNLAPSAAD